MSWLWRLLRRIEVRIQKIARLYDMARELERKAEK